MKATGTILGVITVDGGSSSPRVTKDHGQGAEEPGSGSQALLSVDHF